MTNKEFGDQLDEVLEKAKPKTIIEELREKKSGKNDLKKALTETGYNDEEYKESDYVKLIQKEKDYISSNLPGDLSEDWLRSGGVTKNGKIVLISADGKKGTKIGMIDCQLKNLRLEDWNKEDLQKIELPKAGKLISEFAKEVAEAYKSKELLFFRSNSKEVVEICKIKEKDKVIENGFSPISSARFITLSEKLFIPVIEKPITDSNGKFQGTDFKEKSMNGELCNTILQSHELQDSLPNVVRIFNIPIPILHNGKLTFPKKGFDERFNSYLPYDCPEISNPDMTLSEAKEIIDNLLSEFCFENPEDRTNAIAGLLTPGLKGVFKKFNDRTPIMCYLANRERAGKDYLAGITGLVYDGVAIEDSPISYGVGANNNEELRKKILSVMKLGRRRLHFANNKGHLNSAVIEQISTNSHFQDRALGKNEILDFPNELDISMSGNVGITFTADFQNRSIFSNLFLDLEDANERKFDNPDLHNWVLDNRSLILSAIHSLIKNWVDKGSPKGSIPFASFPEWARVCGGVMESAGYENPCKKSKKELLIGGDTETKDMKKLFELCFNRHPNEFIKMDRVREIMKIEEDLFPYINLEDRAGTTKFSMLFRKYIGRILSGIRLEVDNVENKGQRANYRFVKFE